MRIQPLFRSLGVALLGASTLTWHSTARAQDHEERYLKQRLPAPSNAIELQLSTGYVQGLGNISPGNPIINGAGAGMGFTANVGYRANPFTSIGVEGQYQAFLNQNSAAMTPQGVDANVGVTLHSTPATRGDLWFRLATGYRLFWQGTPRVGPGGGETDLFHGFDLVNARVGYDIRVARNVAFAPVFGANLQTFVWQNSIPLSTVQWATFVYAGLQGRLDAGGESTPSVARAEPPMR
jgi:hypothetical protein